MTRFLLAIAVAGFAAAPVFAMDDMSCADFTAMDRDAQMQALSGMEGGMASEGGMAAGGDSTDAGGMMSSDSGGMMSSDSSSMSSEDQIATVTKACADHPDMMVGDAMGGM